jgi:hypothetical protein
MRKSIILLSTLLLIILFMNYGFAQSDEKAKILSSQSLGDYSKAKKVKKSGKITLQLWEPYIEYANRIPDSSLRNVMLRYNKKIDVSYDEIWTWVRDDGFTQAEKNRLSGQFDIHKVYWKNNKVQALTVEKYYISNPNTKDKVGKHKITQVWDRESILREIGL